MKKVAVLVGSNRRESLNLKFAKALAKLAEGRLEFVFADIANMEMFNDDLVENFPAAPQAMKDVVASADAVLLVTPEYNCTITAVLKSAIDWGTRPVGENAWNGKPGAIVGATPGAIGTAAAQMHLRSIMTGLGLILMGRPEVFVQVGPDLIDENSNITNEDTKKFLSGFIDSLAKWIDRVGE